MTSEEILNMPAGKDLDALIARDVFGMTLDKTFKSEWIVNPKYVDIFGRPSGATGWAPKSYSSNLLMAWEVVEKLCNETGCDIVKVCKRDLELWGEWSCNFGRGAEAFGDTAPLAICRAALLAAR